MSTAYRTNDTTVSRKVAELLGKMTLEEKISQLTSVWVYELLSSKSFDENKAQHHLGGGVGQITRIGGASDVTPDQYVRLANRIQRYLVQETRLGIPAIVHEECCSGLMTRGASLFPQSIGLGATWDPGILRRIGDAIRRQTRLIGGHHALAPVLDVTRDARWGRVEETMGEDPYLVSELGGAYISGIQGNDWSDGVIATAKHFVGYGTTEGGMNWAPAHIGDRELREVYLRPFEAAVRAYGIGSVMNSYGEIDGVACGASRTLLTDILRGEWKFDGMVVSDYFAINMLREYHQIAADKKEAAALAMHAGIDIELPSRDCYSDPLSEAVRHGDISQEDIDLACERILRAKFALGLFDNPYVPEPEDSISLDTDEDRSLAYEAAVRSIVLLENQECVIENAAAPGPALPIWPGVRKIALVGPNSASWRNMIGDYAYPCHIETLGNLGAITDTAHPEETVELSQDFADIVTVHDGLARRLQDAGSNAILQQADGCDVLAEDASGHEAAVSLAAESDIVIAVMGDRSGLVDGCTSGESRDRTDLALPGTQRELLKKLVATGTPVVLVLLNARPVDLSWEQTACAAILAAWLPGEEGGNAVADVLLGNASPGGKLPMSFPRHVGQVPVFHGHKPSGGRSHWAGRYVEMGTDPLYPFGYGLSYTSFELSDLEVETPVVGPAEGALQLKVAVTLRNSGARVGEEVVQLYTRGPRHLITRPVRELRGFVRVQLKPGETKRVPFTVSADQFAFHDEAMRYALFAGTVRVTVGTSAMDPAALSSDFELRAPEGGVEIPVEQRTYRSTVEVNALP